MSLKHRLLSYSVFFLILLAGLVMRASNYPDVFKNYTGHLNFLDPDAYYQLRRLVYFLENFPQNLSFDPLMNWPLGSKVDWPPALVWLYGFPLKLFGVNNFHSLEEGVNALNLFYGLISLIICWFGIRRFVFEKKYHFLALFLAAMSPLMIRYSCLGQVDHHIFELIFAGFGMLASARWLEESTLRNALFVSAAAAGSLLVSGVAIAITLWLPVYLMLALPLKIKWRELLIFFGSYAALVFSVSFVLDHHAVFTLPMLRVAIGGSLLIALGVYVARWQYKRAWIFYSVALLALSAIYYRLLFKIFDVFYENFRPTGILSAVLEAAPLFGRFRPIDLEYVHRNYGYLIYAVFLFCLIGLFMLRNSHKKIWDLLLFAAPFFILLLAQKRFQVFSGLLYVWVLMAGLSLLSARMERVGLKLSTAMGVLVLALVLSPAFQSDFALRFSPMHAVDLPIQKIFLENVPIDEDKAWKRLALKESPPGGIVLNPNLGHVMMYLTGLPTSDNSFYRKSAMVADLNRRDLFEDTDLVGRLREDKMKYIFVIDDLRYHQFLWDLFKTGGFPLVREGFEGGRRLKLWDVDEMERHAWYRLLTTNKIPSGLKLLFGMNVQKTSYQYENLKVFEVLPK